MMNQKWENYESEFSSIFENFDLNEESKLSFTKLNISQIIKSLNDFHSSIVESFNTYSPEVYSIDLRWVIRIVLGFREKSGRHRKQIII